MTQKEKREKFRSLDREILKCETWKDYAEVNRKLNVAETNGELFKCDLKILVKDLSWVHKTIKYRIERETTKMA